MRHVVLRSAFLLLPLLSAAWAAGCSSDDDTPGATPDGGVDSASMVDTSPPEVDAADAASKRDCAADQLADGLWKHLECAGLYSDLASKTIAADAKPYTPGVEFWSDGAVKTRFLYLPPGTKIDITDFDEWRFPVGTRVWKEFIVDGKRIETRLFLKAANEEWRHTTYRWNDAETDAVRKDDGEKVKRASGSPYEVPTTSQCDACHGGKIDQLLGVEAVSLGLPTAKGITLATLAAEGRFDRAPPVTTITIPDDNNGTAAPALGWLHANCGSCHGKDGISGTDLVWRLRVSQMVPDGGAGAVQDLDSWTTAVNTPSSRIDFDAGVGVPYLRIAGGSPSTSLASILVGRRVPDNLEPNTTDQMPPLATRRVDVAGHKLLDDWITQIPP